MSNQTVYPYGTGGSLPSSIGLVNDLETGGANKALAAEQGKFLGKFLFGKTASVSLSGLTVSNYSLGTSDWGGNNGAHVVLPVEPGENYTIGVTASSGNGGWYGFLTSSYVVPSSPTDLVPYVSGTGREWMFLDDKTDIVVPAGCAYICLCTKDGSAKTASWAVTRNYNDYDNTFKDKINEIDSIRDATYTYVLSPIDTSDAVVQNCSLGTTTWYYDANKKPSHIAIPVSGISVVQLTLSACGGASSYYTFVTDSYSPPVSFNSNIPFANGYTQRVSISKLSSIALTVPQNAAYLILTIRDGGGNVATWSVSQRTVLTIDEAFRNYCVHVGDSSSVSVQVPVKIKVASWNVGGFSLGNSGDPSITPTTLDTMKTKWRQAINGLGADVLCCVEYNTNFMDAQGGSEAVTARDAVFTDDVFAYAKIGPQLTINTYMQTAVFANLNLETSSVVYFQHTVQQGRYYQVTETHIAGKPVKIVSVHLDYSSSSAQDDSSRLVRRQQIEELITAFADDDYVILCGDYNVNRIEHSSDYDLFTEAGYKMVNHNGYLGDIGTYIQNGEAVGVLDNIIYKGFVASRVDVINDATLSDHVALYADLTMV